MILSVIICTFNRPRLLGKCINSLLKHKTNNVFEIIVVNNNPNIDLSSVITKGIKLVKEPKIGLSYARNKGLEESLGEYVAFIDDDSIANYRWVDNIFSFIMRYPNILAFGGPYTYFSETSIPKWYPKEIISYSLGRKEKVIRIGQEWINGSNMMFHRKTLLKFGGFSPKLGMKGKNLGYGEETDLLYKYNSHQIPVMYSPNIKIRHWVNPNKLSLLWLLKNSFILGKSGFYISGNNINILRRLYLLISSSILIPIRFISCPKPYVLTRIYYGIREPISHLGAIIAEIQTAL